ncbi:MAG TPA: translocation/assembly module TamB domain-containing protein, partial [Pseudomonadales bacterium]
AELVADVLADDLPFRVTAQSAAFDLAPYIDRDVRLDTVKLSGSGDLHGYRLDVEGNVEDPIASGHVRASARGDWGGMTLTSVRLGDVAVTDMPVSLEEVTGRAQLDWRDAFALTAESVQARGVLMDRPLRADLPALRVGGGGVTLDTLTVRLFAGNLAGVVHVAGRVDAAQQIALQVRAAAFPLGVFGLDVAGLGDLDIALSGAVGRPALRGTLLLRDVEYAGQRLALLSGEVDGFTDAASIAVSARHSDGELDSELFYRREAGGEVLIDLQALNARLTSVPAGARLLGESRIRLVGSAVSLSDTCLELFPTGDALESRLDVARLCLAVEYPDGGLTLNLDPWSLPELLLPTGGVAIRGTATASARLTGFEPLTGRASIELDDLVAAHAGDEQLRLGRIESSLDIRDDTLTAQLRTPAGADQELLLDGRVSAVLASPMADSALRGEIDLELDGIWAAKSLLPMDVTYELERMQGVMEVEADLGGTLGAPLINGVLRLRDVGARVMALNARLSGFGAQARLIASETIAFDSRGEIGSGSLAITGELVGLDSKDPRLNTRFVLDRAEIVDLPDYSGRVSGELALGMSSDELAIKGDLTLNKADIRIADLPETAVSPSSDEVLVGEEAAVPTQQIRTTDVNLTLGKDVRLEAFGLTGRLVGSLRLEEAPRRLRSVTGTISLRDAEFEAYGQLLNVERGRLTFTGPIDDPTVDVEATKVVTYEDRDYKIGLLISGTAKELFTTIRSQPVLAEDDALALLLTGKTISQISDQERSNVSGAALSMGLLNAMGVTQNIATRLNLEEIIVDQDDQGNMEVGAAVRLNRDIYLRYTYGVFSRLGGVLLRYRLSNRVSVQAKTGDSHSIEIRYGVD